MKIQLYLLLLLLLGEITYIAKGDIFFNHIMFDQVQCMITPPEQHRLVIVECIVVCVASVLSGSGVPSSSRSGYIQSKGYPERFAKWDYQVMSSLHQTEHINYTVAGVAPDWVCWK